MGDIVDLNAARRTHGDFQEKYHVSAEIRSSTGAISQRVTDIEDLYSSDAPTNAILNCARGLLKEHERLLTDAQKLLADGDAIGADNEISLFQADLPELFCCRTLSEGFAAVIVALHHATQNKDGAPMTNEQLTAVHRCVEKLHENIFLSFTAALNLIDQLTDTGLKVEPAEAEYLSDILAG
jgi:hypothetical protein